MSLIYNAGLGENTAQTHALVIGVGAYPHLVGGTREDEQPAVRNFGLGQLTSSVASAVALANWLLSYHRNDAPLGSVELLLSPGPYTPSPAAAARLNVALGTALPVGEAKLAAIKTAFAQWYIRVHKQRDNVALFYFGGHGLEASDRYLVAADFGANPLDAFDGLINFTETHTNMNRCRAKSQYFFLDACRDQPTELLAAAARGKVGEALIGQQPGSPQPRNARIYHSASEGQSALGPPGQKSYFTDALLRCLDGMGAGQPDGADWPVDLISLESALKELVARVAEDVKKALSCDVDGPSNVPDPSVLHVAAGPVKVLTSIICQPLAAHANAYLCLEDETGSCAERGQPTPTLWKSVVRSGKCFVEAKFDAPSPYEDVRREEMAMPPLFRRKLMIALKQAGAAAGGNA